MLDVFFLQSTFFVYFHSFKYHTISIYLLYMLNNDAQTKLFRITKINTNYCQHSSSSAFNLPFHSIRHPIHSNHGIFVQQPHRAPTRPSHTPRRGRQSPPPHHPHPGNREKHRLDDGRNRPTRLHRIIPRPRPRSLRPRRPSDTPQWTPYSTTGTI